jgi:hypothetical protein
LDTVGYEFLSLLEKSSALGSFGMGSFVKNTKILVDGGRRDLRSEDDDVETSFLPREV